LGERGSSAYGTEVDMTDAPKAKLPPPLTMFDNLKDAALTFAYDEKEAAILIIATKEGTKTLRYTITKPTVEKLQRWLKSAIVHM
jgi:hypothetical protein